ncbi:MAG: hypothetical protein M1838_003720 [Thelocarpon superellum]|nr:MAG: hypothetical protein M1838_003720 [Thelocarpon superellum]
MATTAANEPSQAQSTPQPTSELATRPSEKHSSFTDRQKTAIILTVSVGSFFSPLSANIYLPALNTLADDLQVSTSLINLTVTTYLIFQGLAPTFIGGFSDSAGRRPSYIICFVLYAAANLGLALQNNYASLLVLRCLQSAGSSSTVALAVAVVADLVTSAERGSYVAYTSIAAILAPSLAPVLGGLLSQYLGWRWIFWFLLIFSAAFFLPVLLFLSETRCEIVGDGSILPPMLNKSLLDLRREKKQASGEHAETRQPRLRFPNPLATLIIIFDREAAIVLFFNGLLFAGYYVITSSIPSQYGRVYGLNDLQISLIFLPLGMGSLLSAFTTGRLIDWNYRRHARRLGFPVVKNRQDDLTHFPLELARLQVALPLLYLGSAAIIANGWTLHLGVSLAGPCVFLFVIGFCLVAAFNCMNILMVDLYPGRAATATAANNLVRCLLGAVGTAVVIPVIDAIGTGWAYTLAALLWVAFSPLMQGHRLHRGCRRQFP